jgi:hypothetical protein
MVEKVASKEEFKESIHSFLENLSKCEIIRERKEKNYTNKEIS